MENRRDNYEIARQQAQRLFVNYDQKAMIRRFHLEEDERYIYLNFVGTPYRILRESGQVFRNSIDHWVSAGFDDSMTIYDVLCTASEDAHLSGNFCRVNSLKGVVLTGNHSVGSGMYDPIARRMDHRIDELREACIRIGGVREGSSGIKGDLVMRLPVFDFLPVILQFYESDDEFPAMVELLWDENIQEYMKYETIWYAAGYLYRRLLDLMDEITPPLQME